MICVVDRCHRSHLSRVGDEVSLVAIAAMSPKAMRHHPIHREALIQYATDENRILYVGAVVVQQGERRVASAIEQRVLASLNWLTFEFRRCEATNPTLYSRFYKAELGVSHYGRDDSIDTHQCMLQGCGAVVVNDLTVVTRSDQARLMLVIVSLSYSTREMDYFLPKGTYGSRENDQLVARRVVDLLCYQKRQTRSA